MTEAQQAIGRGASEPSRLLALCASAPEAEMSAMAEVEKLTLGMIGESAKWPKLGEAHARGAEQVRVWWLHQVGGRWGEEAEEFGRLWAEAFEKAEEEVGKAEPEEAKSAEEVAAPAVITKRAESLIFP